ncbi:aminoglycoside phosphotransferase family protein [Micromonosporaceae bacterium Da 78-11]
MHADQVTLPVETVRALVDDQFPEWRGLPITEVAGHGTVNAIFRVGEELAARFPLRPSAEIRQSLLAEAEAARELAAHTRFRTPEPVALGEPGAGYPLPWSVQTWLPGVVATDEDPGGSVGFAHDLAEFIGEVRTIDTRGRVFEGRGRGGDLRSHDDWVRTCLDRSELLLDVPRLRRMWESLRDLPRVTADTMIHSDLIPGNVLVSDRRLSGILDVGDLKAADPAVDLVGAWHLLDDGPRQAFRAALDCSDLDWERGRAWAFEQAIGLVWYYVDTNPAMSRIGRRTLDRLLSR